MYLGVYLGVSSNSPPGIYKLFITAKSHAPAHIKCRRRFLIPTLSPSDPFHYLLDLTRS